jgi:Uncharacterized protein involved in formation of curli polymers
MKRSAARRVRAAACGAAAALTVGVVTVVTTAAPQARAQAPSAAAAAAAPASTTKRVLVPPMRVNATIASTAPGLGTAFSEMLTSALLERGVRVVERQQLDVLEAEKNLGSHVLDTNSAQKTGKIKGASIALVGSITEFGVRDVKKGALGVVGVLAGGSVKQSELRIKVDVHLVDIATGDILPNSQVVQESKQVDTSWFAGAGSLFRGLPLGGLAGGSSNEWLESKAGKAARRVVEEVADKIASRIPRSAAGAEEAETREVELVGLTDFSQAEAFVAALGKVPGILGVEAHDYTDGVQKLTVTASVKTLSALPSLLQSSPALKPFGFKVSGVNKARIQLKKQ